MTSKPRATSIRTAILATVAIPLIAAVAISVGVAAFLLEEYKRSTVEREATQVATKATDVIETVGRAVRGVAASYMSNVTLIGAVERGDRAALESFAVNEFQTARGIYANIAIYEITDGRGVVVMRGHNPSRAGDDKSRLPLIRAALSGTPAAGIDASPTTGQTAFQAIVPLRSGERIIGTLMVGARLDNATAATIKATTGVDVVLLAGDKIAGSALPDGVTFAMPPEMQRRALAGERFVADMSVGDATYSAGHVPLVGPTGQPAGSVLLLVSHATADAVTRNVTQRLALAGLLILLCAGAAAIWFANRLSRPLREISQATRRVAEGDAASAIPHIGRTDEIGGIAQSVEVFRANSVALAEARAQRESALTKEAAAAMTTAAVVADVRTVVNAAVKGDFSLRAKPVDDPDLNQVVTGVNAVCAASDAFLDSLGMTVASIANGDLTVRMDAGFAGRFGSVAQSLSDAMVTLNQTLADVRETVAATLEKSADIGQSAQELAQRTESQAASIEEMTASVEEFSSSIAHTAQSASELSTLANAAMGRAETGNQLAGSAVKAMLDIEVSSAKVRDIVELIDTIAFQTNLLALNASVEAARAGEQGRGFAVVADEVRRLAQQSGEASKSIRALIETATTQVGEGAKLVRRAGEALDDILGQIRAVNTSVTDISSASREQATGISEISRAIANLDQITQQNANASDQNARSSADLVEQARTLEHMVGAFVLEAHRADKRRAA